ncbi:MAG: nucleotidyltransferase family protein [Thalassobaculaceae bacterium]|nr:nucleotidyltransferase family protein [Thalassobaculaceae bacterium]
MLLSGLSRRPTWLPDTAMVLCAGRGTRLAPLTDTVPKPLVPVCGVPIVDRTLEHLTRAGVKRAVLNAHYLGEQLEDHLKDRAAPEITVLQEDVVLETGGGVRNALPHLGDAPFFVINGDSVWLDGLRNALHRFADTWDPERMDIQLLLYPFARVLGWHGYGDYTMDELGRISGREEGRIAPYAYMGVSIVHPRIFRAAPDGPFSMKRLYDHAEAQGRLFGALHDGLWYHISTPADLEQANQRFAGGHVADVPFF